MNSSKIVLGVLGGIAAGAIAGILSAPEKGSKTRKKILNKGKDFSDEMKEKFDALCNNTTDKYDAILQDTKELAAKNEVK